LSLKHALLGILSCEPMTGYEVKQFFDSSVQHFWNAELSQIYPTLKGLEESGYVDKRVEVQESRPNRKIYAITDTGRDEFLRWVRETQQPSDLRDPFLIKIFFGTEVPTRGRAGVAPPPDGGAEDPLFSGDGAASEDPRGREALAIHAATASSGR
jgi:DNA-binding PadR family transcriptional regulator